MPSLADFMRKIAPPQKVRNTYGQFKKLKKPKA